MAMSIVPSHSWIFLWNNNALKFNRTSGDAMIMILSMLKYLLLLLFYHRHPLKVISNVEITSSDDYPLCY